MIRRGKRSKSTIAAHEKPYLSLVSQTLEALAKLRTNEGAWLDSELEHGERETLVFKIGECLRPFYLAAKAYPERFEPDSILGDALEKDTKLFLQIVEKDRFFPSPYSQIADSKDQYTDFAAFVLDLCQLIHHYWSNRRRQAYLGRGAIKVAAAALAFLVDPAYHIADDDGCRWAGTSEHTRHRKGKPTEHFTDTFFTSQVALSLHGSLGWEVVEVASHRKRVRELVGTAGRWIATRFDGLLTGDEKKSNRALLYTTWGLRALVGTHDCQDVSVRRVIPAITTAYLKAVKTGLENRELSSQEYLTVLSADVDNPLYYEDRTGLGGVLLTMASLQVLTDPDLASLLEEASYNVILERLLNEVYALRGPKTGLWYKDAVILSIHCYLVESFLTLSRGREFGKKIEVPGHVVRHAVKEALLDETVISTLQQAVYEKILRLNEGRRDEAEFEAALRGSHARHPVQRPRHKGAQ